MCVCAMVIYIFFMHIYIIYRHPHTHTMWKNIYITALTFEEGQTGTLNKYLVQFILESLLL